MKKIKLSKYSKLITNSANDKGFFQRVWSTNASIYTNRLKAINFTTKSKILDAGCGYGQWSFPMANLNKEVFSIDNSKQRIKICKNINKELKFRNLNFSVGSIEDIQFKKSTFDAIFAYGVIMTTNWKKALKEFKRVLKKGGELYFTANELGWYLNILINNYNETTDYNTKDVFIDTIQNTERYKLNNKIKINGQIIINKEELFEECRKNKLKVINYADEGKIILNKNIKKTKSFFKGKYYGYTGCYEILLKKI